MGLGLGNGEIAEMEDRGGQHGTGPADGHPFDQMVQRAHPAAGNHRHRHGIADRPRQRQVEPRPRAVAVHAGQQDFARAARRHGAGKVDRIDPGGAPPAMGEHLPPAGGHGLGINRHHDALRTKAVCSLRHHIWIGHGGRIEADLVGPGQQQGAHILGGAHAAAHGQGHEALLGGAGDQIEHRAPVLMRGMDIQETQLVGTCGVIGARRRHRIAGVDQVDEIDTLHHAAIGHVQAGDDPGLQHRFRPLSLCALLRQAGEGGLSAPQAAGRPSPRGYFRE